MNPSPKKSYSLMPYHWNLDGIAADNFGKLYLVDSHALIYSTDITFLAATFLDSSIETNNHKLNTPGCNLLHLLPSYHP